jgi:hypothetical protein
MCSLEHMLLNNLLIFYRYYLQVVVFNVIQFSTRCILNIGRRIKIQNLNDPNFHTPSSESCRIQFYFRVYLHQATRGIHSHIHCGQLLQ